MLRHSDDWPHRGHCRRQMTFGDRGTMLGDPAQCLPSCKQASGIFTVADLQPGWWSHGLRSGNPKIAILSKAASVSPHSRRWPPSQTHGVGWPPG